MDIPIVVVAYNRSESLKRLLGSLENAYYPSKTTLYISIDGGDNEDVKKIADNFNWKHGKKNVLKHKNNIGLRKHILSCGDLALQHDGIIVLEDDLYVSPIFFEFIYEAFHFYNNDDRIAGISLYSHAFNETAQLPFYPLTDKSDVFFLQLASSWGQCWSKKQWKRFSDWYLENSDKKPDSSLKMPSSVLNWPESSWKKYFIRYMIENDLFFVYPKFSFSTNFGDSGIHHVGDNHYQVEIVYEKRSFNFIHFSSSHAKYDSYCEILPECLNTYINTLGDYDYCIDLYGNKPIEQITTEYILSSRNSSNPIYSYARKMIPHEANIISNITGNDIFFSHVKDIATYAQGYTNKRVVYFHKLPRWHLKEKKAEENKTTTLTEKEETLLRIFSKKIGKILIAPILYSHQFYIFVKKSLNQL